MVAIMIGVSGAGKTTIGHLFAARLGWEFHDADDLHSAHNKEKMRHGIALTDEDRRPWLDAVRRLAEQCLADNRSAVIACSALKQVYRDAIDGDPARVKFVYLKASENVIADRLAHRKNHFFDPHLLHSQFETLEEPADALTVDAEQAPERVVDAIRAGLGV